MKINKILVINQPLGNRGDESAHRGFMRSLIDKYPQVQITVLFYNTDRSIDEFRVDSSHVRYVKIMPNLPKQVYRAVSIIHKIIFMNYVTGLISLNFLKLIPSVKKLTEYYNETDLVLCAPGGICLGGFRDWHHAAMLKIAKDVNRPLGYFARSIGPYNDDTAQNSKFKDASIGLLNYCKCISLRDDKSVLIAADLGLNVVKTIDSAFLVEPASDVPDAFVKQINGADYFVIVPNSLMWHYKYKHIPLQTITTFWVELTNRLLFKYPLLKVAMLPQTMFYEKKHPDGYIFFNTIKNCCACSDRVVVVEEQYGSDIQQVIISNAKFLIGARYHSVVFAINQNTPFVSLTYEHKMRGLLDTLNLSDNEINIEQLFVDEESILSNIDIIVDKTTNLSFDVNKKITAVKIATNGFDSFFKKIQS